MLYLLFLLLNMHHIYVLGNIPIVEYDFISGDSFKAMSDFVYDEFVDREAFPVDKIKKGDVIFVKTNFMPSFFKHVHERIKYPYIMITHNSDYPIPMYFHGYLEDEKLIAWFGINVDYKHSKLIPIPIGIQNRGLLIDSMKHARKQYNSANPLFYEMYAGQREFIKKYLVSCMINTETLIAYRSKVLEAFKQKDFCNFFDQPVPYDDYLRIIAESHFIASPEGNGIDCYRTWEALYLGAIPIITHSHLDCMFEDLPVLFVDSWDEITYQFLQDAQSKLTSRSRKMEKLNMSYWCNLINSYRSK